MFELRAGQRNGVDVSLYANQDFSWEQMKQIRLGQRYGVDVLLYLDPKISWEEMEQKRLELERKKGEVE